LIEHIKYILSSQTNPYKNLALEEYLLKHVGKKECILFLWQNEKTVVIGKNQNPWKECRVKVLEAAGGKLVRRLSGGGAVFHDIGNLNFTFLATKENYNVERQLEVIVKAVNQLGIPAVKSGRNDITVEGRKFSGNAFYSDGIHYYHHGTLLVDVDMNQMALYLNVSRDKLISKGVGSVKARVANLKEYYPALDINKMGEELIRAYGEVYGLLPTLLEQADINFSEVTQLEEKFSSWDWIFGKKLEFNYLIGSRFSWGDIDIRLYVNSGIIKQCAVYSDALEIEIFEELAARLIGCQFSTDAIVKTLETIPDNQETAGIMWDIISMILEEEF